MPGSSSTLIKHQYSLQKQTSRTLRGLNVSNASVNTNKMPNSSTITVANLNNSILTNNHSNMLFHRSSTRPPLGIKASNLPISRNLSAQQAQTSNYKSTTISCINNKVSTGKKQIISPSTYISSNSTTTVPQNDHSNQNDYNNTIDSQNDKSLFIVFFE